MEEKLMFTNVLTLTKNLCGLLLHGTIESVNINKQICDTLDNYLNIQNKLYLKMVDKGWYQISNVEQQKVEQIKQKFSN